ncbi:MAG: hypothetical protein M1336_02585 [Deltaproteobacteria bacterium]|nr:hypothetical protein [Deltaproteobacteria bacterium]
MSLEGRAAARQERLAHGVGPQAERPPGTQRLRAAVAELRRRLRRSSLTQAEVCGALGRVFERWRQDGSALRLELAAKLAHSLGLSAALADASVQALMAPFGAAELERAARQMPFQGGVLAFVMPGNLPGAGLHELCLALLAGRAAAIKCASLEPHFFPAFARSVAEAAPELGARMAVFTWDRSQVELTQLLARECDGLVALGDDATVEALARLRAADGDKAGALAEAPVNSALAGAGARFAGFGARVSAVVLAAQALGSGQCDALAGAVARDVALFEQRGCLSPHQVYVEADRQGEAARRFARKLALALASLCQRWPAAVLDVESACAVRRARETARWRALGGEPVELMEGSGLSWTVIYDAAGRFFRSPGYRTVAVTPFYGPDDLMGRLGEMARRLEAVAVADPQGTLEATVSRLRELGATHLCVPGRMHSPPLLWPHGGGAMRRLLGAAP